MSNPTPFPSTPTRPSVTADIAANDDDVVSPATTTAPVRLSYSNDDDGSKRQPSPNREVIGVSSPPKTKRNTGATPSRSNFDQSVFDLFDVNDPSPRSVVPPSSSGAVIISKAQASKLAKIIKNIVEKPLNQKRAILRLRKEPKKKAPKATAKASKKVAAPKKSKKKEAPILSAMLNTEVRRHIFCNNHKELAYSKSEMLAHDKNFNRQLKFRFDERRKRNHANTDGVTTRSNTDEVDLDNNDDVYSGKSTNFKELSRYVLDDILGSKEDTPFLLCIAKDLNEEKRNILSDAAKQQRKSGVGGDECSISGREYYCLRVAIQHARDHLPIMSGLMGESEFLKKYNNKEGFVLRLVGTNNVDSGGGNLGNGVAIPLKLTLSWQDVVDRPLDMMFFGQPFSSQRGFDQMFKDKKTIQYVFHAFKSVAAEYWGDANASAQLYASYLKRKSELLEKWLDDSTKTNTSKLLKSLEDMTLSQKVFVQLFDGLCKNEFWTCVAKYNDYGTEIILEEDLDRFIWAAENVAFPTQWRMLAAMHGGIHEKKETEKDKIQWKKRHVFFQLLSIVRMSNFRLLSWWAMIQSVANFGWGVGATAGDVNCYWGNCVSSSTRSNRLTSLTGNMVFHYRKLMK